MAQDYVNSSGSNSRGRRSKRLRTLSLMTELKSGFLPQYFETKYERDILHALEVIETDVLLRKPIHWNMLLRVVRAMRLNKKTVPHCFKFLQEILRFFGRYPCKDVNVIAEVFVFMIFLTARKPELIFKPPETLSNSIFDDGFSKMFYLNIMKFFYRPYGAEDNELDFVWNAARRGNMNLLKLMLKFGMGMMIPGGTSLSFCDGYINNIPSCLRRHNSAISRADLEMIKQKERSIFQKLSRRFKSESRKRLCLVFRVLEIVCTVQSYPEYKEHFIECYRLIFDSIPEPYVTSVEVQSSLEKFMPYACFGLISEIAKDFKRHLPELAEVPQPRSLQHLCRIQVRQSLRQNLNLPHGVSSLPLPAEIKQYIMLNDDGDYSMIFRHRYDGESYFPATMKYRIDPFIMCPVGRLTMEPISITIIPMEDDCMISFLRNL